MKQGNQPEGPCGGKGEPGSRTVGGKDEGNLVSRKRLNETATDSGTGEEGAEDGPNNAGPSHRRRTSRRSVSANAKGRRGWRGRPVSGGLGSGAGGKPPVAARPLQDRHVPRTTRTTRSHPERRRVSHSAHRHTDLRRQSASTGGDDGAGGGLRAGVSRLLVRLPPRAGRRTKRCSVCGKLRPR